MIKMIKYELIILVLLTGFYSCDKNGKDVSIDSFRVINLEINRVQKAQLLTIQQLLEDKSNIDSLILNDLTNLYDLIQTCKSEITNGQFGQIKFNDIIKDPEKSNELYFKTKSANDTLIVSQIMIGDNNDKRGKELYIKLKLFKTRLLDKTGNSDNKAQIMITLPLTIKDNEKGFLNVWEGDYFEGKTRLGGLIILTQIQNDILKTFIEINK